jgi:hypothetical protein
MNTLLYTFQESSLIRLLHTLKRKVMSQVFLHEIISTSVLEEILMPRLFNGWKVSSTILGIYLYTFLPVTPFFINGTHDLQAFIRHFSITLRRNVSLPSSVLMGNSEDGGDMFLHDVRLSLTCKVLEQRKPCSSYSLLWEAWIWHRHMHLKTMIGWSN